MSWKIYYRILDDPDLFTDMQNYKAEYGDFTADTVKQFCINAPFYTAIDLEDSSIDWRDIADHLNSEEH